MSKAAELAALIANVNKGSSLAAKNFVINGAMNVAQRGTSSTGLGASSGYFVCDRWLTNFSTSGRLTMTQDSSGPSGFANSLKIACTTADTSIASDEQFLLSQRIEGQNLQAFAKGTADAKPFAVSFYVKGNASATYICELHDQDNGRQISKTFNVTTAWTRIELTFPADTTGAFDDDNARSLNLNIALHAGSDLTSGTLSTTWTSTTNANRYVGGSSFFDSTSRTFFITGVQMEIGEKATEFEHEPFSVTLKKCERYFEKTQNYSTAGTSWESGGGVSLRDGTASTVVRYYRFNYKTRKRSSSPTITTYDALSASGKCKIDSTQGITTVIFSSGEGSWCMYPDTSISHYGITAMAWTSESEL